jgi:hypothetical protein
MSSQPMSWYCPDENRDTTLVVVTNDNYDENHAFFFNQFEFPEEPEFSEAEPDVDDDNYEIMCLHDYYLFRSSAR